MKPPVVIGAVGGSGTRVVARIAQASGCFLGGNRNESEDAIDLMEFYDRWINRYLLVENTPIPRQEQELMDRELDSSIAKLRSSIASENSSWGWKNPRSILMLPYFHERFTGMKFIHILRDGRDMAISSNQEQLRRHGPAVLRDYAVNAPQAVRSAAYWARVNETAANYGRLRMGQDYLMIKYETLCHRPKESVLEILEFLGGNSRDADEIAARYVAPSQTTGRWSSLNEPSLVSAVQAELVSALQRFGYA